MRRTSLFACLLLLGACTSLPENASMAPRAMETTAAPLRVSLPTQLEGMDRMTFVMPLGQGHPLCFADDNPEANKTIRFYRYRVEGGPKALYLDLLAELWVPQQVAGNYCTTGTHSVPRAGHWVYEAKICFTPVAADESNCSTQVSAACAAGTEGCAGAVQDVPRGWWVYAYLPPPDIK